MESKWDDTLATSSHCLAYTWLRCLKVYTCVYIYLVLISYM